MIKIEERFCKTFGIKHSSITEHILLRLLVMMRNFECNEVDTIEEFKNQMLLHLIFANEKYKERVLKVFDEVEE